MKVRIVRYKRQVWVWSPYPKGDLIEQLKSVGGKWRPDKKCWVIPNGTDAGFVTIVELVRREYNCALSQSQNGNWNAISSVKANAAADEWPSFVCNKMRGVPPPQRPLLKRMLAWLS